MSVVEPGPRPDISDTVPPGYTGIDEPPADPPPAQPEAPEAPSAEPPAPTLDEAAIREDERARVLAEVQQQQMRYQPPAPTPGAAPNPDQEIGDLLLIDPTAAVQKIRAEVRAEMQQYVAPQVASINQRDVIAIIEEDLGETLTPEARKFIVNVPGIDPNALRQNATARDLIVSAVRDKQRGAKDAQLRRETRIAPEPAKGEPGVNLSASQVRAWNEDRKEHGLKPKTAAEFQEIIDKARGE